MAQPIAPRANYKWIALGIAATSTMLGTSDFSIVLIALPTLTQVFETSTGTVVWVSLAFQLISLGLVLPAGRLGDLFGLKRVFAAGMLVYALGMLLAGFAPGIWWLIVARMVQSAGAAMSNALSSALVTGAFPRSERGKALGILMSSAGVGMMMGPSLGGLLLGTLGWQWIFFARVPLALLAFVATAVYLQRDTRTAEDRRQRGRFDVPGAVTLFLAAVAFALGVNRGSSDGFDSPEFLALAAAFVLLVVGFVSMELRTASPVVDLRLFTRWAFASGCGLMVASTMSLVSMSFLMPFYLMVGKSLSPTAAGLVLLAGPSMTVIMAPIAGRISDSVGPRIPTPIGLGLMSASYMLLSMLSVDSSLGVIIGLLALSALGSAIFNAPNQSAIMGAAPLDRLGSVSALIPTLRNVGLITGLAIAEAIFVAVSGWSGSTSDDAITAGQRAAVVDGVATTLRVFGTVAGVAALVAIVRGEDPRLRATNS